METYKAALRTTAFCGRTDMDRPRTDIDRRATDLDKTQTEKRDVSKAEQFRQKRRCKSISTSTANEIAELEVRLTFWLMNSILILY